MQNKQKIVYRKGDKTPWAGAEGQGGMRPAPAIGARSAARRRKKRRRRNLRIVLILFLITLAVLVLCRGCLEIDLPLTAKDGLPYTIALDAGHGGTDVGAVGAVEESWLTETTVYFLNGWLTADPNYTPVLCREDGENATSTERTNRANQARAQLYLSIHGNSSTDPSAHGFECFPAPPGLTYHEDSLRFAQEICTAMSRAGHTLRGENGVRYTYYVDNGNGGYEKEIAEASNTTKRTDQTFGVLEKARCPAVLAEQCFLTNEEDAAAWATQEGCARAARIYYEAICAYFDTQPLPDNL